MVKKNDSIPTSSTLDNDLPLESFFNNVSEKLKSAESTFSPVWLPENYPLLEGQAIYFVSYTSEPKLFYSKGFESLLGYSKEEIDLELVTNYIHPNQKKMFDNVVKAAISYAVDEELENKTNSNLLLSFNCRKKNGKYIPVTRITGVYEQDEKGRMISSFGVVSDATNILKSFKLKWRLEASPQMRALFDKHLRKEYKGFFTKKELDIIPLIKKGYLSKEISQFLGISKHTVDTHRRNMLKKSNCDNSMELLNFAEQIGVI